MIALNSSNRGANGSAKSTPSSKSRKTSKKQTAANRKNARKSTGPRTRAGKEQSRKNALKHGLFAKHLPTQDLPFLVDPAAYEEQIAQLKEDFKPTTQIEMNIIENLAMEYMRLGYIHATELAQLNGIRPPKQDMDRINNELKHAQSKRSVEELQQDKADIQAAAESMARGKKPALSTELAGSVALQVINGIIHTENGISFQEAELARLEKAQAAAGGRAAERSRLKADIEQYQQRLKYHTDELKRFGPQAIGCSSKEQVAERLQGKTNIPMKYRACWIQILERQVNRINNSLKDIAHWQGQLNALKQSYRSRLLTETLEQDKLRSYEAMVQRNIDRHLKRLKMLKHEILG